MNPRSGFVVSANHTPFRSSAERDAPDPARFAPELGIESRMTNRALRALELFGGDTSITREEFRAYKFDKRYSDASEARRIVAEVLASDVGDDAELRAGQELLRGWQGTAEADDRAAALAILTATPLVVAQLRGEPAPSLLACLSRRRGDAAPPSRPPRPALGFGEPLPARQLRPSGRRRPRRAARDRRLRARARRHLRRALRRLAGDVRGVGQAGPPDDRDRSTSSGARRSTPARRTMPTRSRSSSPSRPSRCSIDEAELRPHVERDYRPGE